MVGSQVILTLNAAGKDALTDPSMSENLYTYLTITPEDGDPFTVQAILNQKGDFSSAKEDQNTASGGKLAEGGLLHGEWHEGNEVNPSLDGAHITSSDLDDKISFSDKVINSTINSGAGNDEILIKKGFVDSSINNDSSIGADNITIYNGASASDGGRHAINTDGGVIKIDDKSTSSSPSKNAKGLIASDNSTISIDAGQSGTVKITASADYKQHDTSAYGIEAQNESLITIDANTLDVQAESAYQYRSPALLSAIKEGKSHGGIGVVAQDNGKVEITVTGSANISGHSAGLAAIRGGENDITVTSGGLLHISNSSGLTNSTLADTTTGVLAYDGVNKLTSAGGKIIIKGFSAGMTATENGENHILNTSEVVISNSAKDIFAQYSGLLASEGGSNTLENITKVDITGYNAGMLAKGPGSVNIIKNAESVDVKSTSDATGNNVMHAAILAHDGGRNEITNIDTLNAESRF